MKIKYFIVFVFLIVGSSYGQTSFKYSYNPNLPFEYFIKANTNGSTNYPSIDTDIYLSYKQKIDSTYIYLIGASAIDTTYAYEFMPYNGFGFIANDTSSGGSGTSINFTAVLYMGPKRFSYYTVRPASYSLFFPVDSINITSEGRTFFRPTENPFSFYYFKLYSASGNGSARITIVSGGYMQERYGR